LTGKKSDFDEFASGISRGRGQALARLSGRLFEPAERHRNVKSDVLMMHQIAALRRT
jgi:hypothetical protein